MPEAAAHDLAPYLFHQGTNYEAYRYMGAHRDADGFVFRVFAPHALAVFLAGDFNGWGYDTPFERVTEAGVWEAHLAHDRFGEYAKYKIIISHNDGKDVYKADPYAFFAEKPPATASVFYDLDGFVWHDDAWLATRRAHVTWPLYEMPLNIYEVHAGSWKRHEDGSPLSYRELAAELAPYVKQMGYTHVELMPVAEHPFDGSWGYQVCGYFAPTARFGEPKDFMAFVDEMHTAGIGVILDWVPAHFPKDEHGLYEFDGSPLYEYTGADKRENSGWGTRRFDVGRTEVQSFLISNALFWLREYHVDGLRADAVASMLYLDYDKKPGEWFPNAFGGNVCLEAVAFFKKLGRAVREAFPDALLIAEESTAFPRVTKPEEEDGLGFHFKWNMGWMNDSLSYFAADPLFRSGNHDKLTFPMMYAFAENYVLPVSHDEVVHGKKSLVDKMPGTYDEKFANLRAFFVYMMTHPGKKLSFMGNEIGQFREWDYKGSIEWFLLDYDKHRDTQRFVADLNALYLSEKALWENDHSWDGFRWLDVDNAAESVLSFARFSKCGELLVAVFNLTPVERKIYPVGLPKGVYDVLLHSDDALYGGSGAPHPTSFKTKREERGGCPDSIRMTLAPLSAVILKKRKEAKEPPA